MKDCIVGSVTFRLCKIRLKHLELCIVKKESVIGANPGVTSEQHTISRFEVMDGYPLIQNNREVIMPFRCFLSSTSDLTPTFRAVNNKFSCKYYLNLVFHDEEDRKYFKQQEIFFWRKQV